MTKLVWVTVDQEEVVLRARTIMELLATSAIAPDPTTQVALARILLNQIVGNVPESPVIQGQILAEVLFAASQIGFGGGQRSIEVAKKH